MFIAKSRQFLSTLDTIATCLKIYLTLKKKKRKISLNNIGCEQT